MHGGLNTFGYAGGNSLIRIDPNGQLFFSPPVLGAISGFVFGAAASLINGKSPSDAFFDGLQGAAAGFISGGGGIFKGFFSAAGTSALRSKIQCGEVDISAALASGGYALFGGIFGANFGDAVVPERLMPVVRNKVGRFFEGIGLLKPKTKDLNSTLRTEVRGVSGAAAEAASAAFIGGTDINCGCGND